MTQRSETLDQAAVVAAPDLRPWQRLPMLVLGFAALLLGLLAGEARLGWAVPLPRPGLMALHGPLMVCGFLGTLIGLERAIAVGRRLAYLGPAASATGGLLLIGGASIVMGAALFTLGALGLVAATYVAYLRQPALYTLTLLLGAGAWLVGNALWLGGVELPQLVIWWAAFLILTIAGERLELSRLLAPSARAHRVFAVLVVLMLTTLVALTVQLPWAGRMLPLVLLGLTAWLVQNDIARRTIHSHGLTRFMALCLLSGYLWLAVSALIGLFADEGLFAGRVYDATLHAIFLGFVFSMVFGHAPVILPSVTRLAVPFHPVFYLHWGVLQLSLLLRVIAQPLGWPADLSLAGALNGIAIALFLLNTVAAVVRGRRARGLFAPTTNSR
ncbi:MAG TPA: hypothetical protein VGE50_12060 [Gammaproteobacteria bacterium]